MNPSQFSLLRFQMYKDKEQYILRGYTIELQHFCCLQPSHVLHETGKKLYYPKHSTKLDKVNCARSARNTVHRAEWKFAIYKWGGVGLLGGKRSGANNHN